VARIDIALPYSGMPSAPFPVSVASIQSISIKCQIYHIELRSEAGLQFEGYSDVAQLGRFYSLTADSRVTRLYTAVNFLHRSNLELLRSLSLVEASPGIPVQSATEVELQTDRICNYEARVTDTLPLLLKVYPHGTLPNLIISSHARKLLLSPPKGFGLKLGEVAQGTVLIIAGGTGLYPFSDLIDLLFKDALVKQNHAMKAHILRQDPVLSKDPFARHKFKLLLACQSVEDIHPVTFKQLRTLASAPQF
jgi:hypothetical protein